MTAQPATAIFTETTPEPVKCCKVCGRALPDRRGKPGRPSPFCRPNAGEEMSLCARLDKRFFEIKDLAEKIMEDCKIAGESDESVRQRFQVLKGYLWSEANAATNRGRLVGSSKDRKRYGKKRSGWWRLAPNDGPVERKKKEAPKVYTPSRPKACCPACLVSIAIREDGRLYRHRVAGEDVVCSGSGQRAVI